MYAAGILSYGWQFSEVRKLYWGIFASPDKGNGTVSSIVKSISDAAVQLVDRDVEIVDANDELVDNTFTQSVWNKLRSPNDFDTLPNFTRKAIQSLSVVGDGFIYRTSPSYPELGGEIFILPAHKIGIQIGTIEQPISGYTYEGLIYHSKPKLNPDNTIMFANANLDDTQFFGLSPLATIIKDLDSMDKGKLLRNTQLGTGGVQNLLFPKIATTTTEMGEQITNKTTIADAIQRLLNRGSAKNTVVNTPLDRVDLGNTAVSLGIEDVIKSTKEDICNAYSYPIDLLRGQSTYSNQQQARLEKYIIALPYVETYLSALNKVFNLAQYGLHFRVNDSTIMKLQQDLTAEMAARKGISTINEQRAIVGLEPYDNPAADQIMVTLNEMPLEQTTEDNFNNEDDDNNNNNT